MSHSTQKVVGNEKNIDSERVNDLVGRAVEEYFQLRRSGHPPKLSDFAKRYSEIADLLMTVVPALDATEETCDGLADTEQLESQSKQLGDFRILKQIGRGGMGIVYEAEQISMQRRVALKVLPLAGLVNESKIRRFQNEVRAVASLDHPNIVSVYMVGEERGVHYYAMQLVRGRSLAEVADSLRQLGSLRLDGSSISRVSKSDVSDRGEAVGSDAQTLDLGSDTARKAEPNIDTVTQANSTTLHNSSDIGFYRSVVMLGIQAGSALQHAHDQGIIHRDIKPANMLLDQNSKLFLADFGLARIESDVGVTMTGDLIGTLRYMAPEQALAKRVAVDHRADIYSLAASLYELLTLQPVYPSTDRQQLLKQIAFEEPIKLRRIAPNIPAELETIVHKAMSKDRDQRYASAQEFVDDLTAHLQNRPIQAKPPTLIESVGKWTRRNLVLTWATGISLALITAILSISLYFILKHRGIANERSSRVNVVEQEVAKVQGELENERWARTEALPELQRLIQAGKHAQALELGLEAEQHLPNDPNLASLWDKFSVLTTITTNVDGAEVSYRNWNQPNGEWTQLGRTPVKNVRLPKGKFHWKVGLHGYDTAHLLTSAAGNSMKFTLAATGSLPKGMSQVKGGRVYMSLGGLSHHGFMRLADFLIDNHEVSNDEYQQFVDQGGYATRENWGHPLVQGEGELSWEDGVALFVDSTGSIGPAQWINGHFPAGEADFPVRGISWYEAAAYAKFAGKELPTIYQWSHAAELWAAAEIIPISNFGVQGPAMRGSHQGVTRHGAFDMAGNVKEWCLNSAGSDHRYILGGAWDEPEYMFNYPDDQPAMARDPNYGFRCVQGLNAEGTSPETFGEFLRFPCDFTAIEAATEAEFELFTSLYEYENKPLNPQTEYAKKKELYTHEKIEFDAAYGDDRVPAHLYLPTNVEPPYQTVVYFPPAFVLHLGKFNEDEMSTHISYYVESGRAVLYPVFQGTFERKPAPRSAVQAETPEYRDFVIAWSQDLSRSIDYLETRSDIAKSQLAYYGYSWGGCLAPIMLANEPRFKVAILTGAGCKEQPTYPFLEPLKFAAHVKVPVLMLNGRYNTFFRLESAVEPFFRMFGADEADKSLLAFDCGQSLPREALIQESQRWLDKYLGPVKRKPESPVVLLDD